MTRHPWTDAMWVGIAWMVFVAAMCWMAGCSPDPSGNCGPSAPARMKSPVAPTIECRERIHPIP